MRPTRFASIRLQPHRLHQPRIHPDLPLELLSERLRGHRRRRSANALETFAHARRVQRLDDFAAQSAPFAGVIRATRAVPVEVSPS